LRSDSNASGRGRERRDIQTAANKVGNLLCEGLTKSLYKDAPSTAAANVGLARGLVLVSQAREGECGVIIQQCHFDDKWNIPSAGPPRDLNILNPFVVIMPMPSIIKKNSHHHGQPSAKVYVWPGSHRWPRPATWRPCAKWLKETAVAVEAKVGELIAFNVALAHSGAELVLDDTPHGIKFGIRGHYHINSPLYQAPLPGHHEWLRSACKLCESCTCTELPDLDGNMTLKGLLAAK
jgi:hypothetical protein